LDAANLNSGLDYMSPLDPGRVIDSGERIARAGADATVV